MEWGGGQCAKDFVSLVGNDDSQNKLNKSLLIVECCSGLGLIKIGKSKRLKRVWFGGIRRAFSALGLPGRSCGIRGYRRPETVIGTSSTPVGNWGAFPLGRRNPQHRPGSGRFMLRAVWGPVWYVDSLGRGLSC